MKKLLFLLPILVAGCSVGKYVSASEARSACRNWEVGGFRFEWENKFGKKVGSSRDCYLEEATRQYLGFEYQKFKRDKVYQGFPNKVIKRFKY